MFMFPHRHRLLPALLFLAIQVAGCARITLPSNGLALTPPMGWSSWNAFATDIDDASVRATADSLVASGMRDAGYVYVNIDDGWQGTRDAQGNLHPNARFPDMHALADYVHSKGLKLGIYTSPGRTTCGGYIGSYGHESQDAATFAAWGVDYLKYDWCAASQEYRDDQISNVYRSMAEALRATGRPIVYSVCEYGAANVTEWAPEVGANLWRTTNDIRDNWQSVLSNIELQSIDGSFAGPGHWNDPDMLEVGNGDLTDDENRTQMSLWALSAAPLIAGNDLRFMSAATVAILLNKEVIAIDQDPLGKQAFMSQQGMLQIWKKPLSDGSIALGIVNLAPARATVKLDDRDIGPNGIPVSTRDLWSHEDIHFANHMYTTQLPPHGVLLLRASFR